jgi:hypothetical protein
MKTRKQSHIILPQASIGHGLKLMGRGSRVPEKRRKVDASSFTINSTKSRMQRKMKTQAYEMQPENDSLSGSQLVSLVIDRAPHRESKQCLEIRCALRKKKTPYKIYKPSSVKTANKNQHNPCRYNCQDTQETRICLGPHRDAATCP